MSNVRYSQEVLENTGEEKDHYRFGNQEKPKGGIDLSKIWTGKTYLSWENMFFAHDTKLKTMVILSKCRKTKCDK